MLLIFAQVLYSLEFFREGELKINRFKNALNCC
jgi:hypothetical protein